MILFTGRGSSGSWVVRGEQVGGWVGEAVMQATLQQCKPADIIVAVKRVNPPLLDAIRRSKKPWVFDVVDCYPQPLCTQWNRDTAIRWIRSHIKRLSPTGVIWPNRKMMEDCSTGLPEAVIYHHHRPELVPQTPTGPVQRVGYEGSARYLGEWLEPIQRECKRRGWEFHVNTLPVDQLDIVLGVRGKEFDGYAQRHWKSNVKLANAHGAGAVFIGLSENGYTETRSPMDMFVSNPEELPDAFNAASSIAYRQAAADAGEGKRITLESVTEQYRAFLSGL